MSKSRLLGAVGIVAVLTAAVLAQAPDGPLAFDVASIKSSGPSSRGAVAPNSPDSYARRYLVFLQFVADAYDVSPRQIVGVPPALATARFDITAKAPFVPTPEQRRQMLQRLLAERFALQVHRETRNLEVYALRVGKNFGRPDDGFRKTNLNCADIKAERAKADGTVPPMLNALGRPVCSGFFFAGNPPPGSDHLLGSGVTTKELVDLLAGFVGRLAIDETNLTDYFDVDLTFDRSSGRVTSSAATSSAPSIFTALSDVGLRLDGTTAPVDVLVIDHAGPPTKD